MAQVANIEGILVETDAPELVLARDVVGTIYLALMTERSHGQVRFLCVPISSKRLADLRYGQVDLRDAFVRREAGAFSGAYVQAGEAGQLHLSPVDPIPLRWLPDAGFPLVDFLPEVLEDDLGLNAVALERRKSVGVFELHPPEAYEEPKIDSYEERLVESVGMGKPDTQLAGKVVGNIRHVVRHYPPYFEDEASSISRKASHSSLRSGSANSSAIQRVDPLTALQLLLALESDVVVPAWGPR